MTSQIDRSFICVICGQILGGWKSETRNLVRAGGRKFLIPHSYFRISQLFRRVDVGPRIGKLGRYRRAHDPIVIGQVPKTPTTRRDLLLDQRPSHGFVDRQQRLNETTARSRQDGPCSGPPLVKQPANGLGRDPRHIARRGDPRRLGRPSKGGQHPRHRARNIRRIRKPHQASKGVRDLPRPGQHDLPDVGLQRPYRRLGEGRASVNEGLFRPPHATALAADEHNTTDLAAAPGV